MLMFSYDEDNIYSLKVSETIKIKTYQETNTFRLKNVDSNNVTQQFALNPEYVEGIPLQRYEHYDFMDQENPNVVSLISHELWDELENFTITFVKNVKEEHNYYLFQDFLNNENIVINSSEGSGEIELTQKIYLTQRDKKYYLVSITQKDLLKEFGLPITSISFQEELYGEEVEYKWVSSLFYDEIKRNETKCFYVKLKLRRLDIDGIFRDLILNVSQTEE